MAPAPATATAPKVPKAAGLQQQQKKKKKNPPDKPQPAWLFPPKEENPVLNPKQKTEEEIKRDAVDYENALDHLKRRVYSAPNKPAPPSHLLSMIAAFLAEYGFLSTGRLFTSERQARRKLNGWEDNIGIKLDKGTPSLVKVYKDWYRDWKIDESSSSENGDEESESEEENETTKKDGFKSKDSDSSSGSGSESDESDSDSDVKMKDTPKSTKESKIVKKSSVPSASPSTSSDSDADDEEESRTAKAPPLEKDSVGSLINKLKRKASSPEPSTAEPSNSFAKKQKVQMTKTTTTATNPNSLAAPEGSIVSTTKTTKIIAEKPYEQASSSDPSSSSDSESDSSAESSSKAKITAKSQKGKKIGTKPLPIKAKSSSSGSEDEESGSSNSGSSECEGGVPATAAPGPKPDTKATSTSRNSSTSSVTINGDSKKPSESLDSDSSSATSESEEEKPTTKTTPKTETGPPTRRGKPTTTHPASINSKTISNAYVPYDYAERAHRDLSVTRGKGFTKEKNKKKRGSYRGGQIDLSGGKGHKFEN
jgi:hypothetical protein